MSKKKELVNLLDFYLGNSSEFLLDKELKVVGVKDLEKTSQDQKRRLIASIMTDIIYPVVSKQQLFAVRTKLCQVLEVDETSL